MLRRKKLNPAGHISRGSNETHRAERKVGRGRSRSLGTGDIKGERARNEGEIEKDEEEWQKMRKKRRGVETRRHISGCSGGLWRLSGFDLAYTLCVSVCECVFVCVWPVRGAHCQRPGLQD